MKKRIFAAINISDNLKKEIAEFRQKFNNLPVRWMRDENLHLTLIPPQGLSDNEIVDWIERLKKIEGKFGPIEIEFEKICLGPNPRRPRLIWLEGEENPKLEELRNKMTQILGIREIKEKFKIHLTLARFRPRDFARFSIKNLSEKTDWADTAKSISVIQSECLRDGARYTNLAEIEL